MVSEQRLEDANRKHRRVVDVWGPRLSTPEGTISGMREEKGSSTDQEMSRVTYRPTHDVTDLHQMVINDVG